MAIIKSKYEGYGEVRLSETGHDYDFIAVIENYGKDFKSIH